MVSSSSSHVESYVELQCLWFTIRPSPQSKMEMREEHKGATHYISPCFRKMMQMEPRVPGQTRGDYIGTHFWGIAKWQRFEINSTHPNGASSGIRIGLGRALNIGRPNSFKNRYFSRFGGLRIKKGDAALGAREDCRGIFSIEICSLDSFKFKLLFYHKSSNEKN
jgi:hypothetical protein